MTPNPTSQCQSVRSDPFGGHPSGLRSRVWGQNRPPHHRSSRCNPWCHVFEKANAAFPRGQSFLGGGCIISQRAPRPYTSHYDASFFDCSHKSSKRFPWLARSSRKSKAIYRPIPSGDSHPGCSPPNNPGIRTILPAFVPDKSSRKDGIPGSTCAPSQSHCAPGDTP